MALGLSSLSLSCYTEYLGIYWIPGENSIDLKEVDQQIYGTIRDLGFVRKKGYFLKSAQTLPLNGVRLEGDESIVSVSVWGDPLEGITVRDSTTRRETEFTREVKRRIEECLRENYGLTDLKFQRQREIVPN